MKYSMKQLTVARMTGDIRECLKNGFTLKGVRNYLMKRFVNFDNDITTEEFEIVLNKEYDRLHGEG
ncbi:hypothetical protein AGMMS49992_31100 [Clostridia bacterium]|nr:hypothetical protein AGMMS49992_31100 [Clostridia bacterium]